MKKLKQILSMFWAVMLIVMLVPQSVFASSVDVEVRPTVTIKANVPEGFTENIGFVLEQETTQVRFSYALTAENGYTGSLSLPRGGTYLASATFQSSGQHNIDLAEKYDIAGTDVELVFNVTPITYSVESDETTDNSDEVSVETETEVNRGEEIDETTGLPTGESIFKKFEETVAFMENDSNFDSILSIYSNDKFKKYYLESNPSNTEEKWDNMNRTEQFTYYITYYYPHLCMMNDEFAYADEFIDELVAQKQLLEKIENGNIVYDAIVEVWEWLYDYWEVTGTFYNFFNAYDGTENGTGTSSEPVTLTDSDTVETITDTTEEPETAVEEKATEQPQTEDEFAKDVKEDNSIGAWVNNNKLTLIILIASGIAVLVVYLLAKKKKAEDDSDK